MRHAYVVWYGMVEVCEGAPVGGGQPGWDKGALSAQMQVLSTANVDSCRKGALSAQMQVRSTAQMQVLSTANVDSCRN